MKLAVFCGAVEYEQLAEDLARIHARYPDLTIRGGGLCAAIRWGHENGVAVEEDEVTGPESMADPDAEGKRDRRLIDGADAVLIYHLTHPRYWVRPEVEAALAYAQAQGRRLWLRELTRNWLTDLMDENPAGGWPHRPDEED
jgi:hypothetical protein